MSLLMRFGAGLTLTFALLGCGETDETPTPTPPVASKNELTIATLTPAAGALVSRSTTVTATLNYNLDDSEKSEYGYRVTLQFQSTNPSTTFSGSNGTVVLPNRKGTVSISTPLSSIWDRTNPAPLHPITCYFYLQRLTSATSSEVIAKTSAITFTE
ncbi:hypothetical protein LJY25_07990 [Hymenobacter sp. BT175]|uniref:hypothetical protein n=1 Tax=Hymenobacter translucens TaxID=2886507 RepID=UPI001D0ECEAB|nr:hypothetical protein [Hymenobacter translucens]MCC2546382.1 hypothetical protein [Hymenobacter translucens]